jgi:formylglycine-generating enzyme required for sulfatase activity
MTLTFQNIIKSINYIVLGILFLGNVIVVVSDLRELIDFNLATIITLLIISSWIFLYYWMKKNKPFWGAGENKVRIIKPNIQINLFTLGMIILLWIPVFFPKNQDNPTKNTSEETEKEPLPKLDTIEIPAGIYNVGLNKKTLKRAEDLIGEKIIDTVFELQAELPAFSLSKYEITNKEYKLFVEETGYQKPFTWNNIEFKEYSKLNNPVVGVSWYDAMEYCRWLEKKYTSKKIRLPTETEWEIAAKGITENIFPWGDKVPRGTFVNFKGSNSGKPIPVDKNASQPSPFGAVHMGGNVEEWCYEAYHDEKDSEDKKVVRGGNFKSFPSELRCTAYRFVSPKERSLEIGFRILIKDE